MNIKHIFLLFLFVAFNSYSQTPTKALEIEAILVHACGSPESDNEMVRFAVGPTAINIYSLEAGGGPSNSYPSAFGWGNFATVSQSWFGCVQNTLTAATTASINASIVGCGFVLEPPLGILPAGSKALLFCSQFVNPMANSFANLNDTLYVIYHDHNANPAQGDFGNGNYSAPSGTCIGGAATCSSCSPITSTPYTPAGAPIRIFALRVNFNSALSDTVYYNKNLLVNTLGQYGGNICLNRGSTVHYSWPGNPVLTYTNYACTAPVNILGVTVPSSSVPICVSASQTFTANISGTYSYLSWSGGTGTFAASTTTGLTNTYTSGPGDGPVTTLSCSVTRTCAAKSFSATSTFTLSVLKAPIITSSASSVSICPGQNASLSLTVTNSSSTGSLNVTWSSGQTGSAITTNSAGVYTSTVVGQCGSSSASFTVASIPIPTISLSANTTTLCSGSTATISASSSEGTYTWTTGSSAYSIAVSPTITTNYTVSTANSCSVVSATQTISVINVPTVSLNNTLFNSCSSQSVNIIASTNGTTFAWSTGASSSSVTVSPTVNTVYSFTSSNICFQAIVTASVNLPANPTLNVSASSSTLCNGNSATITANASTGTYSWSTGATANSIVISPANTSSYSVSSTNSCAVTVTSVQTISVFPNPVVSVSVIPTIFCIGQTATLSAGLNPLNYNYSWSGPSLIGTTTASTALLNGGGIYSVSVTDNVTGCYGTTSLIVQPSIVTASFTANPIIGPGPLNVNFTNQSSGANTFGWNFGNVSNASSVNPSAIFNNPGTYVVTLTSSTNGNCSDTYTLLITVEEGLGPVPEVITPNGDGKNDVFEIKGLDNYPNNHLQIYNRWGNAVYNSKPYKNNWDGVPNATGKTGSGKLPAGTYYYLLELGDNNNTYFKGFVEVVY